MNSWKFAFMGGKLTLITFILWSSNQKNPYTLTDAGLLVLVVNVSPLTMVFCSPRPLDAASFLACSRSILARSFSSSCLDFGLWYCKDIIIHHNVTLFECYYLCVNF